MLNKIETLFQNRKDKILSIYFTAGYPNLVDTATIINQLSIANVDMIEVGIPFSDPLADGPVIQHSSEVALKNGMSLKVLFKQLENSVLTGKQQPPLLLMGYLNPVLQYGIEKFCKDANRCGIAGVIIPDLPLQEYINEYKSTFEKYDLLNIFLITPQTTEKRIRLIDKHSKGFIYMVAASSTTGVKNSVDKSQEKYFARIKSLKLKNPLLVGFGIANKETYLKACKYAAGAIVGSAFVKALEKSSNLEKNINHFIQSIR